MIDRYYRKVLEREIKEILEAGIFEEEMHIPSTPQKLAIDILQRSRCAVMVGAVIADRHGIFAWGWNNEGDGWGKHAEQHAISRANRSRMEGASIYIAGTRKRTGTPVEARPCVDCLGYIIAAGIKRIYWRNKVDDWMMEYAQ